MMMQNVLLVDRHGPNVARNLDPNSRDHLVSRLKTQVSQHVVVADFSNMSINEQIRQARNSDLFIGTHGAGMAHVLFLPQHRGVVEISEWPAPVQRTSSANIYMNMAAWTNHPYRSVGGELDGPYIRFELNLVVRAALQLTRGHSLVRRAEARDWHGSSHKR